MVQNYWEHGLGLDVDQVSQYDEIKAEALETSKRWTEELLNRMHSNVLLCVCDIQGGVLQLSDVPNSGWSINCSNVCMLSQ